MKRTRNCRKRLDVIILRQRTKKFRLMEEELKYMGNKNLIAAGILSVMLEKNENGIIHFGRATLEEPGSR